MSVKRELFSVAGVARDSKGVIKVRFAINMNDRIAKLKRNGFTEIKFIELPEQYLKNEAIEYLMKCEEFNDYRNLLVDTLLKYE